VCPSCESQEVIKRGVDERNQLVNAMHVTTVTHVLMI
jgi:hypothetical protein